MTKQQLSIRRKKLDEKQAEQQQNAEIAKYEQQQFSEYEAKERQKYEEEINKAQKKYEKYLKYLSELEGSVSGASVAPEPQAPVAPEEHQPAESPAPVQQ